ncbi:MAG: hypothetical protein OXF11_15240 [Deltaproteobacteria bacterium]|nr:hypothetical protein [Deltaproteobacteria bacterium]
MGLFYDVLHRLDIPRRVDQGKVPNYKTFKHALYGIQEGTRAGCHVMFPFRNMTVDHVVPQSTGGADHIGQPSATVRGLQLDEGNAEPGRICRGPGVGRSATIRSTDLTTAKPKKSEHGRPENPKYQETEVVPLRWTGRRQK